MGGTVEERPVQRRVHVSPVHDYKNCPVCQEPMHYDGWGGDYREFCPRCEDAWEERFDERETKEEEDEDGDE